MWQLWTRLLPLLAILISKAGVNTDSNQETVEKKLLLQWLYLFIKFSGQWFKYVILISFCTCDDVYMSDR